MGSTSAAETCKCCQRVIHKQSVRTHAGYLSHNMKRSHLMAHINQQHKKKVKELERIEAKKMHYMMSPTRSLARTLDRTVAGESFDSSFKLNESFFTNSLPQGVKKSQSVDSNSMRQ